MHLSYSVWDIVLLVFLQLQLGFYYLKKNKCIVYCYLISELLATFLKHWLTLSLGLMVYQLYPEPCSMEKKV